MEMYLVCEVVQDNMLRVAQVSSRYEDAVAWIKTHWDEGKYFIVKSWKMGRL